MARVSLCLLLLRRVSAITRRAPAEWSVRDGAGRPTPANSLGHPDGPEQLYDSLNTNVHWIKFLKLTGLLPSTGYKEQKNLPLEIGRAVVP